MKTPQFIKRRQQNKVQLNVTEDGFLDDLYDDYDDSWQLKASRLQARRLRKIKHQLV